MGLLRYVLGLGMLGSLRKDYIPMTPSTAIGFILLGSVLIYVNAKQLAGTISTVPLILT